MWGFSAGRTAPLSPGTDMNAPPGALARGVAACAFCIGLIAGASERAPERRPR